MSYDSDYEAGFQAGQAHAERRFIEFLRQAEQLCAYEEPDEDVVADFRQRARELLKEIDAP